MVSTSSATLLVALTLFSSILIALDSPSHLLSLATTKLEIPTFFTLPPVKLLLSSCLLVLSISPSTLVLFSSPASVTTFGTIPTPTAFKRPTSKVSPTPLLSFTLFPTIYCNSVPLSSRPLPVPLVVTNSADSHPTSSTLSSLFCPIPTFGLSAIRMLPLITSILMSSLTTVSVKDSPLPSCSLLVLTITSLMLVFSAGAQSARTFGMTRTPTVFVNLRPTLLMSLSFCATNSTTRLSALLPLTNKACTCSISCCPVLTSFSLSLTTTATSFLPPTHKVPSTPTPIPISSMEPLGHRPHHFGSRAI